MDHTISHYASHEGYRLDIESFGIQPLDASHVRNKLPLPLNSRSNTSWIPSEGL